MTAVATDGVALAALWRLLSLGFASPTDETLGEVEVLADALVAAGSPAEVDEILLELARSTREDLAADHAYLFGGTVRVSPYEGSYELDPIRQGRQMADVAAFYRAFGAEAHGPTPERPDFVACELEFLSFLELRRLVALENEEDGADLLGRIAASFLEDHAGRWLPTFFAAVVEEATAAPFYRALGDLGLRVVGEELERRGIEPAPLPRRGARTSVEADGFDCGAGTMANPVT